MKNNIFYSFAVTAISAISAASFHPNSGVAGDNIKLSYRFDEPIISCSGQYHRVEIPGLSTTLEAGKPKIPFKTARILLPRGTTYSDIKVTFAEMKPIPGEYLIEPSQRSYTDESYKEVIQNQDIYSSSDHYPEANYKIVTIQNKRGYRIICINIFPLQYIPKDGKLSFCNEAEVEVIIQSAKTVEGFRGLWDDQVLIMKIIDNPEALESYPCKMENIRVARGGRSEPALPPQLEATPIEYVIITNNTLKNASGPYNFQTLEAHREANGLNSTIVTIEQISGAYPGDKPGGGEDNQTRIRNFLIDAYNKWKLKYALLGGNVDIIPVRHFFTEYDPNSPADLYYACLDVECTFNYDID